MPWSFIIPAAASLIGGSMQANAAEDAAASANAQQDKALALQTRMYEEGIKRQQPYSDVGLEFTNKLAAMQRGGPGAGAEMLNMDPGYGFRLSEGRNALAHQAAARGGLVSGQTLKAMQNYAQNTASQEFGNAYNRMAGLAALGPSSAGIQNNLGQNYSTAASNTYGTMGANTGNARMAGASAYGSALSGIGAAYGRNPVSFGSLYGGNSMGPQYGQQPLDSSFDQYLAK